MIEKATQAALRSALDECEKAVFQGYPVWLKAVDRLATLRATISCPTVLTRAVDKYLTKAKP